MTNAAMMNLDDIRAIFAASKLQDRMMNDATIEFCTDGYRAVVEYYYGDGEVGIFEGRGKTPYDALVGLSKEIRQWCYGDTSKFENTSYGDYVQAAITSSGGSS